MGGCCLLVANKWLPECVRGWVWEKNLEVEAGGDLGLKGWKAIGQDWLRGQWSYPSLF